MGEGPATGFAVLAVLGLLGVPAPVFALILSLAAFVVAVVALSRVNDVVRQLDERNTGQAVEISELAADPRGEGGDEDP